MPQNMVPLRSDVERVPQDRRQVSLFSSRVHEEAGGGVLLHEIGSGSVQSWRLGRRWTAALPANNHRLNATRAAVLRVTSAEYHLTA